MSALSVEDLRVDLSGTPIVRGVSLHVDAGSWVSVIGPNGAGKSTILRALAGVVESSGTVRLTGRDAASLNRRERGQLLAWVPQSPLIPTGMRVVDYVLLGRTPHLGFLASESASDVDLAVEVLADLDLAGFAERSVDTLSGGEVQRLAIARAVAQQAPVMLLDEPTSALDLGHQQEVLRLLDRLRRERGLAVLSTMHDLTLAGQHGDELLLVADGEVAVRGSAREVLTSANISEHYGADVEVIERDGVVVVIPAFET